MIQWKVSRWSDQGKRERLLQPEDVEVFLTAEAQRSERPEASGAQASGPGTGQEQEEHLAMQNRTSRRGGPLHRHFGKADRLSYL